MDKIERCKLHIEFHEAMEKHYLVLRDSSILLNVLTIIFSRLSSDFNSIILGSFAHAFFEIGLVLFILPLKDFIDNRKVLNAWKRALDKESKGL